MAPSLFFVMSGVLDKILQRLEQKSFNQVLIETLEQPMFKSMIIETIQQRLLKTGEDSFGAPLRTDVSIEQNLHPYYSAYTAEKKDEEGQITSHVTLNDSGDLFASMKVVVKRTLVSIQSDLKKGGSHVYDNFTDSYSSRKIFDQFIFSLSDRELNQFCQALLPKLITNVRKNYFR